MPLSEELIKIGKESNPKSNLSMAESSKKMFKFRKTTNILSHCCHCSYGIIYV